MLTKKRKLVSFETDDRSRIGDYKMERDEIFISHRTTDAVVAEMIKDFLVNTGITNEKIFCSSLPGNDVDEKIASEIKEHLQKSTIIIQILSRDYYKSAYCLNEAGIAWYLEDVLVIPFALPEIDHNNMQGFVGAEYKLRRLNDDGDAAYLIDMAQNRLQTKNVSYSIIMSAVKKLKERYEDYIVKREDDDSEDDRGSDDDYDDDIWVDGYHEVKDGDGKVLKKGQFTDGRLIDGIEYNIFLKVTKHNSEEPVLPNELTNGEFDYGEYGQYGGVMMFALIDEDIREMGISLFYVADKKVKLEGRQIKPTYTNFRTLESFLAKYEPDELEYIKTGIRKYEEMDSADFDLS